MDRVAIEYGGSPRVRSVNVALRPVTLGTGRSAAATGIAKTSVAAPVAVRAPGLRATGYGGGLVGDTVVDRKHHGGDDQAVYAYAREDLDHFAALLGRELGDGSFGENLTTTGLDVSGAIIGERWRVGERLLLTVRGPRIPCGTFRAWIGERGWLKTFDAAGLPGTYLAVTEPGEVAAGDPIEVVDRPDHDVRVCDLYRAMTGETDRWRAIVSAASVHLSAEARAAAAAAHR